MIYGFYYHILIYMTQLEYSIIILIIVKLDRTQLASDHSANHITEFYHLRGRIP